MTLVLLILCLWTNCAATSSDTRRDCADNPNGTRRILEGGSIARYDCNNNLVEKHEVHPEYYELSAIGILPLGDPSDKDYQQYRHAKLESDMNALSYRANVFAWQYRASIIIFVVVVTLVLSGLCFAAIQFRIAIRAQLLSLEKTKATLAAISSGDSRGISNQPSGAAQAEVASAPTLDVTTIEASLKGIKISSSVLGLLILVISMCFFYLYLVYVYPIKIVDG